LLLSLLKYFLLNEKYTGFWGLCSFIKLYLELHLHFTW
jgi:hypothetical protein